MIDSVEGASAVTPDPQQAVKLYKIASKAGHPDAGVSLANMYLGGRGVERSRRKASAWLRRAAENGNSMACYTMGTHVYANVNRARIVGYVEQESWYLADDQRLRVAMHGHDVPRQVLWNVVYWFQKGGWDPADGLHACLKTAVEGVALCSNNGCTLQGGMKSFKVCGRCMVQQYCGPVCQAADWLRHKAEDCCKCT